MTRFYFHFIYSFSPSLYPTCVHRLFRVRPNYNLIGRPQTVSTDRRTDADVRTNAVRDPFFFFNFFFIIPSYTIRRHGRAGLQQAKRFGIWPALFFFFFIRGKFRAVVRVSHPRTNTFGIGRRKMPTLNMRADCRTLSGEISRKQLIFYSTLGQVFSIRERRIYEM